MISKTTGQSILLEGLWTENTDAISSTFLISESIFIELWFGQATSKFGI